MATTTYLQDFIQLHCVGPNGQIDLSRLLHHKHWRKETTAFHDMIHSRLPNRIKISRMVGVGPIGSIVNHSVFMTCNIGYWNSIVPNAASFHDEWTEHNRPTEGRLTGYFERPEGIMPAHAILIAGIADKGDDIIRAATAVRAAGMQVDHVFAVMASPMGVEVLAQADLILTALAPLPLPQQAAA